ncbi:hypothetical protein T02_1028, partial [Trichinella nativa]
LTYLSEDPKDPLILTPYHFLTGTNFMDLPEVNPEDEEWVLRATTASELRNVWSYHQRLIALWWKRWKAEYIVALNKFQKWLKATKRHKWEILKLLLSSYRLRLRSKNLAITQGIAPRELSSTALSHLDFRRDVTTHLLRAKPRLTIRTGRRAHPPETLRITEGHYLEPISQGRCRVCKKNCRLHCVECRERLHRKCFPLYHRVST